MSSCHTLSLDLGDHDRELTASEKRLQFEGRQAYWDYFFGDLRNLPSLKTLKISTLLGEYSDCPLPSDKLIKWLKQRNENGLALKDIIIQGFDQMTALSMHRLKQIVPQITYRCGDDKARQSLNKSRETMEQLLLADARYKSLCALMD